MASIVSSYGNPGARVAASYTWATKPAAVSVPTYTEIWVTDIAQTPVKMFSDGTTWQADTPIELSTISRTAILHSFLAANASIYSQTGTLVTVTSAAHLLHNGLDGADIYLHPATGAAAEGTYSNFTYINANSFSCTSTVSQTTSGTLTSKASINQILPSYNVTLRGGLMGAFGQIEEIAVLEAAGSGAKNYYGFGFDTTFGTCNTQISGASKATRVISNISNRGVENKQLIIVNVSSGLGFGAAAPIYYTRDTSADMLLETVASVSSANEWLAVHSRCLALHRSSV